MSVADHDAAMRADFEAAAKAAGHNVARMQAGHYAIAATNSMWWAWQEATRRASARPLTPIGTVRVSAWSVSWRTADNALFKIGAAAPGKYEVFIRAAAEPEEKR